MARNGFTPIDASVTGVAALVAASVAVVGAGVVRDDARTARCIDNLHQTGMGNAQFALANNDLMAGYTWQQGGANSLYPDLVALQAGSTLGAHAAQAIDILRRLGRPDLPAISGWLPDISYWSLPLVEFQGRPLDDTFNICPNDAHLQMWRRNPSAFDHGAFLPLQPSPLGTNKRWPYSSSYQLTAGAWDQNQSILTTQAAALRLSQASTQNAFNIPGNSAAGPSGLSLVALPSRKVYAYNAFARHRGSRVLYVGYADAIQPMLFFDGAVSQRRTGDARQSWRPNQPISMLPQTFDYVPSSWEAPTLSGMPTDVVQGWLRWTRDGLLGWDYAN